MELAISIITASIAVAAAFITISALRAARKARLEASWWYSASIRDSQRLHQQLVFERRAAVAEVCALNQTINGLKKQAAAREEQNA